MMLDATHDPLRSLGSSVAMRELRASIVAAALEGRDLVLSGEPGTGRRWVARAIHCLGRHEGTGWVEADARQVAPSDVEALVGSAAFGTLVLRELAEADAALRAAVHAAARARQQGDARLVATVGDPRPSLAGCFDGHYVALRLPPLRERERDDVAAVLSNVHQALLSEMSASTQLHDAVRERLLRHPWPGNIREMRNAVERALIAAGDAATVTVDHLPAELRAGSDGAVESRPATLAEVERAHIERTVRRHAGNRTRAARELGISRATLITKIRVYALDV